VESQKLQSSQTLARLDGSVDILILLFQMCIFHTMLYTFMYLVTDALVIYVVLLWL